MLFSVVILALGLVHLTASVNLPKRWDNLVEKHAWADLPNGWNYKATPPADSVFTLKIALKQHRFDELVDNLMEISNPTHIRYAQHLTKEEAKEFIAPHPDSVQIVDDWLAFHGVDLAQSSTQRSNAGDWISTQVTVEQAERMLGTKYNVYEHAQSKDQVVRTLSYSLPQELHFHIDVVMPTTYFGTMRSMKATSFLEPDIELQPSVEEGSHLGTFPPGCGTVITPKCLSALYHIDGYVPQAANINMLGVAGYLNQYANYADLQTFFRKFRPDAIGSNFTTSLIHGGLNDQEDPGVEANLDIQYTTGLSFPTPNMYYSTGGSPPYIPDSATPSNTNEPYVDFLNYLFNQSFIPQVLTTSYGDDEQTVPRDYAVKVCDSFAQLGALGTTIFFSSGDAGVGADNCKTNDGKNDTIFQPAFPASCPFVTAVGGTTSVPEKAANFSGGGFSRYFPRPSYQEADVSRFLAGLGSTYEGLYNAKGRAYPDLSAQAQGYRVILNGTIISVGGTSASSPTVAAIFSLLNDLRLATGKASLGFINPLIYSTARSGFNDITVGSNPGCGTTGFSAGNGWDPVTGLGTPDFDKLKCLVEDL